MNKLKLKFFKVLLNYTSKEKSRYFLDFNTFSLGFFISFAFALIISIIVNMSMSKEDLAIYNFNKSVIEFVSYILTLVLYRSYLRFNINGANISIFRKVMRLNFIAFLLLEILTYYLTKSFWALLFPFFIFYEERLYFFRSIMKIKSLNFLKILTSLFTLITVIILFFQKSIKPNYLLLSYGIGFFISVFFYKKNRKVVIDLDIIPWNKILAYSLPVVGLIIVRLSLDISSQYLIKLNFDLAQLSIYAIGTRVLLSVKVFSSILMMFFPVIYFREIKKKNNKFINKIRHGLTLIMFSIVVMSIIFSEKIYHIMGASTYIENINVFRLLSISEFIFIVGGFWGIYLSYAIKTYITFSIFFVGAILNLIILYFFLPDYGIYTAPVSILISNVFISVTLIICSYRLESKYLNS